MPIQGGVGYSDNTPKKQETFAAIIDVHTQIVKRIMNNKRHVYTEKEYLYIDMNSGPGFYNGIKGSPCLFMDMARKNGVKFIAVLSELRSSSADSLASIIDGSASGAAYKAACSMLGNSNVTACNVGQGDISIICNEMNKRTLSSVSEFYNLKHKSDGQYSPPRKYPYGIIYADPNNHRAGFNYIGEFFKNKVFKYMDVLIHVSATSIKRTLYRGQSDRIDESIHQIGKKYWIIRKPGGAWQWTFLMGTNWDKHPVLENHDMVRLDSDQGQEYLTLMKYTKEELSHSIKPTSSIYHTQYSLT